MARVTTTLLNVVVLAALAAPSALSVLACSGPGDTATGEKSQDQRDVRRLPIVQRKVDFLDGNDAFAPDRSRERLWLTSCPGSWLKRVR